MSIQVEPQALIFADDGSIPNNPRLPFLVYRNAIDLSDTPDPEAVVEKTFARHGWGEMWRNGIYPYVHYHSKIHEALGIARGRARVRFGGVGGEFIEQICGDGTSTLGAVNNAVALRLLPLQVRRTGGSRRPRR